MSFWLSQRTAVGPAAVAVCPLVCKVVLVLWAQAQEMVAGWLEEEPPAC